MARSEFHYDQMAASMAIAFFEVAPGCPIRAEACGTPVIVTDFASMPELVRWGVKVPLADRFWVSGLESWWAWPDWRGVRDALHKTADLKRSATAVTRE